MPQSTVFGGSPAGSSSRGWGGGQERSCRRLSPWPSRPRSTVWLHDEFISRGYQVEVAHPAQVAAGPGDKNPIHAHLVGLISKRIEHKLEMMAEARLLKNVAGIGDKTGVDRRQRPPLVRRPGPERPARATRTGLRPS